MNGLIGWLPVGPLPVGEGRLPLGQHRRLLAWLPFGRIPHLIKICAGAFVFDSWRRLFLFDLAFSLIAFSFIIDRS